MIYHLGRIYKYPCSPTKFKLVETNGFVFHFECGHFCTDNVFMDPVGFAEFVSGNFAPYVATNEIIRYINYEDTVNKNANPSTFLIGEILELYREDLNKKK